MKTLKNKGYAIKAAGSRHSRNGRIQPCLLIQGITGGVTIDGNRRQLGRQLRQLARSL